MTSSESDSVSVFSSEYRQLPSSSCCCTGLFQSDDAEANITGVDREQCRHRLAMSLRKDSFLNNATSIYESPGGSRAGDHENEARDDSSGDREFFFTPAPSRQTRLSYQQTFHSSYLFRMCELDRRARVRSSVGCFQSIAYESMWRLVACTGDRCRPQKTSEATRQHALVGILATCRISQCVWNHISAS